MSTKLIVVVVGLVLCGRVVAAPLPCVCDVDGNGQVTVAELVGGVTSVLQGCVTPIPPTPTRTIGPTITPTPGVPRCGEPQTVLVRVDRAATCLGVHGQLEWLPGEMRLVKSEAIQTGCLVWDAGMEGKRDWMTLCSKPFGSDSLYPYALTVVPLKSTTITGSIVEAVTDDPPRPCSATFQPIQVMCR